jgi:ferrochelatase
LAEVVADLNETDTVVLVPLAPFSVSVYHEAAKRELAKLPAPPRLLCVPPWGRQPSLLRGWARTVQGELDKAPAASVVVSAHSLPMQVIRAGDAYASEFEASADALELQLGAPLIRAYQSQGAMEGEWLGPSLNDLIRDRDFPSNSVIVAPIGFLSEHVETLFDLDVEAKQLAVARGLTLLRAPAVGAFPELVVALGELVSEALSETNRAI